MSFIRAVSAASATTLGVSFSTTDIFIESRIGSVSWGSVTVVNSGTAALHYELIPCEMYRLAKTQVRYCYSYAAA